jgi:hypothetical protein
MRKVQVIVALNLLLTVNACQKDKELKPLVVHPEDVQGFWVGAAKNEAKSPSLAFYFENSNLETMSGSKDALDCGVSRPYQIVGNSVLDLAATDGCEATTIQVMDLNADSMEVSYNNVRYKLVHSNSTELEFFVSSSGAQENELSPAYRPYLIPPQDDSSIDSALKTHQAEFYGIQFKVNKKMPAGSKVVIGSRTLESEQYCILLNGAEDKVGATFAIDELKLELPRDHDNIWHVRNKLSPTEVLGMTEDQRKARLDQWQSGILSTQSARLNRVDFINVHAEIYLRCERSLKKSPWTVAEVQKELNKLGGTLSLETISAQAQDVSEPL